MFEQDRYGAPLFAHIAGGVAIGLIVGGVVLYGLWSVHLQIQMAQAEKDMKAAMQGVQRSFQQPSTAPLQRTQTVPPTPRSPCAPGDSTGVLNGEAVCVSKYGQVTPIRR